MFFITIFVRERWIKCRENVRDLRLHNKEYTNSNLINKP